MPTDNSAVYGLPAPLDADQALLGALRMRQLRDKLEQELTRPWAVAEAIAAQSIPDAVYSVMAYGAVFGDREAGFVAATGKYTIKRSGAYLVTAQAAYAANATGTRQIALHRNDAQVRRVAVKPDSVYSASVAITCVLSLVQNDVIDARLFQNSGGPLSTVNPYGYNNLALTFLGR